MEAAVAKENTNGHAPDPDREPPKGIFCPKCWCTWCPVYSTRPLPGGKVRQYRRCMNHLCRRTFTTTISGGVSPAR
jgi:hypothetical protein